MPSGPDHVHGLAMPSRYSSEGSITDAAALARALGIDLRTVPIEPAHGALSTVIAGALGDAPAGLTDENLQSRIRGVILMAVSNARGWIVLTTGNKSELATGYSTLYGDSAGGFAVIKDVPEDARLPRCAGTATPAAGTELIPEAGPDQGTVGRAAPRPARRPEPAPLRRPRPSARGARRSTTGRSPM